jgi:hypothetical protein
MHKIPRPMATTAVAHAFYVCTFHEQEFPSVNKRLQAGARDSGNTWKEPPLVNGHLG